MGVMGMFPLYTLPKSYQKDNFEPCQDFLVLIKNVLMGSLWGAGNQTLLVFFFIFLSLFFFSIWVFFHEHSRITGLQWKGEGISLTPNYHFHPLHRHLGIGRAITARSSALRIASSRTRTGTFVFRAQVANH